MGKGNGSGDPGKDLFEKGLAVMRKAILAVRGGAHAVIANAGEVRAIEGALVYLAAGRDVAREEVVALRAGLADAVELNGELLAEIDRLRAAGRGTNVCASAPGPGCDEGSMFALIDLGDPVWGQSS